MNNKYINRLNEILTNNSQKKCVFRRALKVAKQADVLILLGRVFHQVAAATTNELSPAFTCVRTTVNKLLFVECNVKGAFSVAA